MSYSCAYFKKDDDTLEQAQHNKVHYILEKLALEEGMTLLDIGCGWGYLLIEAAKKYGIKGYGCTLSKEQWKKGQERIEALDLQDKVQIDLVDYRDLVAEGASTTASSASACWNTSVVPTILYIWKRPAIS